MQLSCLLNSCSLLGHKHTFDHQRRYILSTRLLAFLYPLAPKQCACQHHQPILGAINALFSRLFYINLLLYHLNATPSPTTAAIMLFYRGTIPNANINITNQGYILYTSSSVRSGPLVQPSTNKFPENKSLPQPTTTTHRSITTMCHIHLASPSLLGLHPPENPHP